MVFASFGMTGEAVYHYRRSERPTECVHVSNLGRRCYFGSEEDLLRELRAFGSVRELRLGEGSSSFVIFGDLPASRRFYEHCMQEHAGEPVLIGGRRVKVGYSEKVEVVGREVRSGEDYEGNERFLMQRGLVLVRDFVSGSEAEDLLGWIDTKGVWETVLNRRVQHYGYSFDYKNKIIGSVRERDIPGVFLGLAERMVALGLLGEVPDQVTVNEYEVGKGIGPHIDSHHTIGEEISVISLGSGILFDFYELRIPEDGGGGLDKPSGGFRKYDRVGRRTVYIPENSLYIMKEEIRYSWEHGIKSRKFDSVQGEDGAQRRRRRGRRLSITFRKYRGSHHQCPCECDFGGFCDSRDPSLRVLPERI